MYGVHGVHGKLALRLVAVEFKRETETSLSQLCLMELIVLEMMYKHKTVVLIAAQVRFSVYSTKTM